MSHLKRNCLRCKNETANAGLICGLCLDLSECDQAIKREISAIRKNLANTIERRQQDVSRLSFEHWERCKQLALEHDGLGA